MAGSEGGFFGNGKFLEIGFGDDRGRFSRGTKVQPGDNYVGTRCDRGGGKSLGELEPKFTRITGNQKARVDYRRIDGRTEGKVGNSRGAFGEVGGNGGGDRIS
jgi:hypothetical protein